MAQDTKLVSVATGAVYSANLQTPVPIFPQLRFVHSLIDLGHGHYTSSIFFFLAFGRWRESIDDYPVGLIRLFRFGSSIFNYTFKKFLLFPIRIRNTSFLCDI